MPDNDEQDDETPVFTYEPPEQESGHWEVVADVLKGVTNIIHGADGGHHH
ncbi:hypothetical protein [Streptomyces tateyamensis]|nr:hypothetical protein [Streptomyces tateyamensis]